MYTGSRRIGGTREAEEAKGSNKEVRLPDHNMIAFGCRRWKERERESVDREHQPPSLACVWHRLASSIELSQSRLCWRCCLLESLVPLLRSMRKAVGAPLVPG